MDLASSTTSSASASTGAGASSAAAKMRQWRGTDAVTEREALAGRKAAVGRSGVLEGRRRRGSVAVAMDGARDDG